LLNHVGKRLRHAPFDQAAVAHRYAGGGVRLQRRNGRRRHQRGEKRDFTLPEDLSVVGFDEISTTQWRIAGSSQTPRHVISCRKA